MKLYLIHERSEESVLLSSIMKFVEKVSVSSKQIELIKLSLKSWEPESECMIYSGSFRCPHFVKCEVFDQNSNSVN